MKTQVKQQKVPKLTIPKGAGPGGPGTATKTAAKTVPKTTVVNGDRPTKEAQSTTPQGPAKETQGPTKEAQSTESQRPVKETESVGTQGSTKEPESIVQQTSKRSPYELVRPQTEYADRSVSWASDATLMGVGDKWWSSKPKKYQNTSLVMVFTVFTLIFVVVVSLITSSLIYLLKRREAGKLHPNLRTKTSACRANYPDDAKRIVESDDQDDCDPDHHLCRFVWWEFKLEIDGAIHFDYTDETKPAMNLDNARCDYLKWCMKGKCVYSGVNKKQWWLRANPFVEALPPVYKSPAEITCFRQAKSAKVKKAWEQFTNYTGKCKYEMCANSVVHSALPVELQECNMNEDRQRGQVMAPCGPNEPPAVVGQCKLCEGYNQTVANKYKEKVVDDCRNRNISIVDSEYVVTCGTDKYFMPDGFLCQAKHHCLLGKCIPTRS